MDSILVVNAGLQRQVRGVCGWWAREVTRKIKGQIDGIGTRPRLRASGANGTSLIDREYDVATIPDVPAALQSAGAWVREEQRMPPNAVRHRVVHGGPSATAWF
jgi:acetate kinase